MRTPRHSTVVAYVALFAALGGSATAATQLKRNSVGTAQIRNGSVHVSDLARSARPLTKARIAQAVTDQMTSSEVLAALSTAVKGQKGDAGPSGPQGGQGPQGPQGTPTVNIRTSSVQVSPGATGIGVSACASGEKVTGGGGSMEGESGSSTTAGSTLNSAPTDAGDGWSVQMTNRGTQSHPLVVTAICTVVG